MSHSQIQKISSSQSINDKMPSPRPRILGSPRLKNKDADKDRNPQSPAAPASRRIPDEPDCEIIKIEDDDEEPRQRIGTVQFVKQCPMRLQEQFNGSLTQSVVAPISPSLALQFVPDTSMGGSTHARNIYSRQNVVMVLPVNTASPQVFKAPTLCTLERIDNPREITRIQQVVATQKGNPGPPIIDSDARTMKARSDGKKEFHNARKKILQQIFENDSTDKPSDSSARSLIPWKNKRKSDGSAPFFNNRSGSTSRVDSFNLVMTSNSMSKGSGINFSSMDVRESFVSESKKSASTFCFVTRAGSDSLLRKPAGNETSLGDRSRVSRSNAPSSRVVSSDIQECFVSVSSNSVGKSYVAGRTSLDCPLKKPASSTSSMDKQNGAFFKSREPTATKSLSGNSERPVPPLTMIGDKTRLYEESSESISVLEEPPDDVNLLENKKQSISPPQKPSAGNSEKKKLPISSPKELIVSIIPLDTEKDSIPSAQPKEPIVNASPLGTEKDSISSARPKEPIVNASPLETEKDSISSARSVEPIVNASPLETEKDSISSARSIKSIPNAIPLDAEKDSISSPRSKETIEPSTTSQITKLSSQKDKPLSNPERIETNSDEDRSVTITADTSSCESIVAHSRKPRCIACREKFSDRTELHRHATLAHRGVQIVFCDICSDAFLTDLELQEHRLSYCERYPMFEASIDDEVEVSSANSKTDGPISDKQASPKRRKQLRATSEPSPGHSRSPKEKIRGRPPKKKVIGDSGRSTNLPKSRPVSPDSSGVEKRKPQTKNKSVIVKYSYVEEDVIRHIATAAKFKSAEIKKLVVPVTRLEGPVLEKYLEKLSTRPVTSFGGGKPTRKGNYGRPKGKLKVSPRQSKNIVNVRRGKRKRWPTMKLRIGYMNRRKPRQTAVNERYSKDSDNDSDEMPSNNSSRSSFRARSVSDEFPTSDDAMTDARRNKKTARVELASKIYSDSDEPTCSDISSVKFVSKTDAKKTKKKNVERRKSFVKKSADQNGDSSDEKEDGEAFARNDVIMKDRKIIRKLTSRSSAASVAALEKNRPLRASKNSRGASNDREEESSTISTVIIRSSPERDEKSLTRNDASAHEESTRGLDDTDNDEVVRNGESFLDDGNESERAKTSTRPGDSRESKASLVSQIPARKTYLPNKRNSKVAKKPIQECRDAKSNVTKVQDLCRMCEEFLTKLVATHFGGKKTRRTSLACPFCNMHFITMFYLEKHVARKHLHCKSEPQCRRSKSAADPRLDCETEVKLALECRQCTTKFSEENDLDDHVMEHHDKSKSPKDISTTDSPDYLKDNQACQEASSEIPRKDRSDEKSCSRSTKRRRVTETRSSRARATRKRESLRTVVDSIDLSKINESSMENLSTVECWVCDTKFDEISAYNSHMREVHDILKSNKSMRSVKSDRTASSNSEILVLEASSSAGEEVAPRPKLNAKDQITADRQYLLKQLLSDDSMDGFEEYDDTSREVTVELVGANMDGSSGKRVIGLMSTAHTCKVCSKQFNRTQDLLMHSLSHETESTDDEAKPSKLARTEISSPRFSEELFADPSTNDFEMDVESDPASERKIDSHQSGCEAANEVCPIGDDLFTGNGGLEESNDFLNIHGHNGANERVVISEKQRAAMLKEKPKNSADRKPSISSKKPRCEKNLPAAPEVPRTNNGRHCTLKEFLDTEKGLANADGTNVNDRVPIECGKCNRQFPTQAALNEHLFFLHDDSLKDTVLTDVLKTEQKSIRRWRCKACRQDFKLLQGYSRHRYIMHGDESMVHVCENCCKILTTVTMVNVHICTDVASYNCRTCDKTFSTGMSLRLHNTEKHMETDEPNICKPCNKRFLTKAMLTRHENSRHRFLRPYRPRKRSPVMMATHGVVADNEGESWDRTLEGSENCALYSEGDEDEGMDLGFEGREASGKKYQSTLVRNAMFVGPKGQRGRSRQKSGDHCNSSDNPNARDFDQRATVEKSKDTTNYIDESEIYQCSLCKLYCLTKVALDAHVEKIHSGIRKVCQLCRKMYVEGGLIRHVIDEHVSPCETYKVKKDSIWNDRKDIKERDTELFVRILGMKRFMSMWDYQISEESAKGSSINCPTCKMNFPTTSMYRFHFLTHHDTMCVLCNIEFKSGEDAAKHKKEEHRSPACYIWFVDRILKDVTAVKDYQKIMERSFMEMISRDTAESDEDNGDSFDGALETKETKFRGDCAENIIVKVESKEETELEEKPTFSEDSKVKLENEEEEEDDKKLILVVTDEDLDKYNIGQRYPNIWGLASQISSTCEKLTPKDVKEMLEAYFEN